MSLIYDRSKMERLQYKIEFIQYSIILNYEILVLPLPQVEIHMLPQLNEQPYNETGCPACCRAVNIGQPVRCQGPSPLPPEL